MIQRLVVYVMGSSFRQTTSANFYLLLNAQCCILEEVWPN